jgi:WD40 repeat protein
LCLLLGWSLAGRCQAAEVSARFLAPEATYSEGAGTVKVNVLVESLTGDPLPQPLTIDYSVGGTATPGADYTALSGSVAVVANGGAAAVAEIAVALTNDATPENIETIELELADTATVEVSQENSRFVLKIRDDDTPTVSFVTSAHTVKEDAGLVAVQVALSPAPDGPITVAYRVTGTAAPGVDYGTLTGTLAVPTGAESVTIPIQVTNDTEEENQVESVVLELLPVAEAAGGVPAYQVGSASDFTLLIQDNEPPTVSFFKADSRVLESAGDVTVVAQLSRASTETIVVQYALSGTASPSGNGQDYQAPEVSSLTFQPGTAQVNIPVKIMDDSEFEGLETIVFTLAKPGNAGLGEIVTHTLTIVDNEKARVEFQASEASAAESIGSFAATVTLSEVAPEDIVIQYALSGTAEAEKDYYPPTQKTVTIYKGTSSSFLNFTIVDDTEKEKKETIVTTITGSPSNVDIGVNNMNTLTILDNDQYPAKLVSPEGQNASVPDVAIDSEGNAHIIWKANNNLWYTKIDKDYQVVVPAKEIYRSSSSAVLVPRIAVDKAGVVHVVHATTSRTILNYVRIEDGVYKMSRAFQIYPSTTYNNQVYDWPAIAITPSGQPIVVAEGRVYDDATPAPNGINFIATVELDGEGRPILETRWAPFSRKFGVAFGSYSFDGYGRPDLAYDSTGNLHVVWRHKEDAKGAAPDPAWTTWSVVHARKGLKWKGKFYHEISLDRNVLMTYGGPQIASSGARQMDIVWCSTANAMYWQRIESNGDPVNLGGVGPQEPTLLSSFARYPEVTGGFGKTFFGWMYEDRSGAPVQIYSSNTSDLTAARSVSDSEGATSFERMAARSASAADYVWKEGAGVYYRSLASGVTIESSENYNRLTRTLDIRARATDLVQQPITSQNADDFSWKMTDNSGTARGEGKLKWSDGAGEWVATYTLPEGKTLEPGSYPIRYSLSANTRGGQKLTGESLSVLTVAKPFTVIGTITDKDGKPVAGATVAARIRKNQPPSREVLSGGDGKYKLEDLVESDARIVTVSKNGYGENALPIEPPSNGAQVVIDLTLPDQTVGPAITAGKLTYGSGESVLLSGLSNFRDKYVVNVNWNGGTPKKVTFSSNDTKETKEIEVGTSAPDFFELEFDVSQWFSGVTNVGRYAITVVAEDQEGRKAERVEPINVVALPELFRLILATVIPKLPTDLDLFLSGEVTLVKLKNTKNLPFLGYLGPEVEVVLGMVYKLTNGEWSVGINGSMDDDAKKLSEGRKYYRGNERDQNNHRKVLFRYGEKEVEIKPSFTMSGKATPTAGISFEKAVVGLEVAFKDTIISFLLTDLFPGGQIARFLDYLKKWKFDINSIQRLNIVGGLSGKGEAQLCVSPVRIENLDSELGASLSAVYNPRLYKALTAELSVGGEGALKTRLLQIPELKGIEFKALVRALFKWKDMEVVKGEYPFLTYPSEGGAGIQALFSPNSLLADGVSVTGQRPVSRAYLANGPSAFVAGGTAAIQSGSGETPLDRFRKLGTEGAQPVQAVSGSVKAEGASVTSGLEQADLTLVTNVYPDSTPALASHGSTLMLVYSADNGGADLQFADIHWTWYDGTSWSAPAPIQTNTQGEFAPQVAFDGDGDAVAVWERVKDPNLTSANLDVIMPLYEIVWARWDHTAHTWSTPVALTDNGYLDQCPQLCGPMADGSLLLTWKSNAQNYFVGSDTAPTTVHWARFDANSNTWSAPASLVSDLTGERAETLAGAGNLAVYAYTRELDLATSSTQDTEVYYTKYNGSSWSAPARLTNNAVLDDSIRAAVTATGKTYLVWQMGSDLVMNQDFETTTSLVRANSNSMGFMDFALAPNPDGNLGLIWQAQTAEGTNALYTVYDPASGVWSQDRRLFQDAAIEYAYAPAWDTLGNLTVAYNRQAVSLTTQTVALGGGGSVTIGGVPTRGQADLAVVKRALVKDLAILPGDLTYSAGPLLPGEGVDFYIQVRNTGDLPIQGASVVLFDGNPTAGGVEVARRVLGDWFEGGTSVTVTFNWTIPEPMSAHTLYAVVDADAAVTEFNEYNNQQWVTLGGTDLSPMEVVSSSAQSDGSARLVVRVRNAGGPESPVATLAVRPAGGAGAALATASIPALAAGTSAEVAVDLPAGSVPPETPVKLDVRTDDTGVVEDVDRSNDLMTTELMGAADASPAAAAVVEVKTDLDEIPVAEAGTTVFHVWLSAMPSAPVSLAVTAVAGGDPDLTVSTGATFTIQPSAWNTPVAVTLAAAADGDSANGTGQFLIAESGSTIGVVSKQIQAMEMDDDAQNVVGGTLAANTTWNDTTKDYLITSQLVVPAGVTLTIGPGVRVRHGGSLDFTPIKVNGTLVASDADFLLYTRAEYYNSWRFNGIEVLSGGNVQLNRCSLRSIERNYTDQWRWSAILTSLEASTIQVKGCSFESLNTLSGNRTSFGVQLRSLPNGTVGDDTTQATPIPCSFKGFSYGIGWKFGTGVQNIGVCQFQDCQSNMRIWGEVTGSAVVRNKGTQILFDCTNAEQYVSNGTVVVKAGGSLTFETSSTLTADDPNRLLVVEAGGSLALTGAEVDSVAPIRVYGTMQATDTVFLGRTARLYYASSRVSSLEVYAGGTANLQTCSFYVREANVTSDFNWWAAHVWVAPPDTVNTLVGGQLHADGCFFTSVNCESTVPSAALLLQTDRNWDVTHSGFVGNAYTVWTGNSYGVTGSMAAAPTFTGNFFENSRNYAVYNNTQTRLDAPDNWWGSATGPRYVGNAAGLGDPVTDYVNYTGLSLEPSFPMVRFVNPVTGQERDNLEVGATVPAVELLGFRVTPQAAQVREVGFRLSEAAGSFLWNQMANFRLAVDANGDGRISGSEQTTVGGEALLLTEGSNQTVVFSDPFVSENSPSGAYILLADVRDVVAGQGFTVALNDRFCRVPAGTGIETEADSARHMAGPAVILSNPADGQLSDQLNAYAAQEDVRLLGFQLKGDATKQVERLTVRLSNVEGLTAQKIRSVSLIADTNGNGVVDAGETAVGGVPVVSVSGGAGTIEFSRQTFPTENAYLVVADFAYLSGGNRFTVGLSTSDIKLVGTGTVTGAANPVTHIVKYPLQLSKSAAWQTPTNFGASVSQDDVAILGFQLAPAGIEVQALQLEMSNMTGIEIGDIGSARVYWDKNGNGLVDAGDELVVGDGQLQITETGAGTIRFDTPFMSRGDMIAVANFANLKDGDEITFSIRSEGIAVGAGQMVSGTAPEARLVVGGGLGDNPNQNMKWTLTYRSPGGTRVSGRFNHAGNRVILGYDTGSAWVFDSESNTPLIMLKDHYDKVRYAGFSSDDSAAVTVSRDGAVYIWDLNTSGSLRSAMFADLLVTYAVPSPDFSKLMIITEGKGMLLDIDTQKRLWEYVPGNATVNAIAYSPDGKTIAVGTSDNFAYLVNAATGVQVGQAFLGHSQAVTAVGFTGDGSYLMTASTDATVQLWNLATHMPVRTISLTGQNAQGATVSYDGKRICMITGSGNQAMLRMYDELGLELYQINLNDVSGGNWGGSLENVTFDDAGQRVLVNSSGNGWAPSAVFRVSDGSFVRQFGPQGYFSDWNSARPRISQDGARVFYETNWGMNLVQRERGKTIRRSDGLNGIYGFDVSNDGSKLGWITNEWQGRFQVEAVSDEGFSKVLDRALTTQYYTNISLSPDGNLAALGDRLYSAKTGDLFANYASPDGNYQSAFSGDGSKWGFAIANSKSLITLRTSDPNAVLYNMTNTNPYTPYKILYHPDGRRIGMVDQYTGVQMYDMPKQLPVGLYRFEGTNYDAALSQDGSLLLIGGDNTVRLYDVKTGRILRYFYPMHSSLLDVRVRSVQFARNDSLIMIAWSYNYVETYERSQADHIEITPSLRVLKPSENQEYTVELVYDDSTRRDITPRSGVEATSVTIEIEPASMATIQNNVLTVAPNAEGELVLRARYRESGRNLTGEARVQVSAEGAKLVSLVADPNHLALNPGVFRNIRYTAWWDDGYSTDVSADVTLTADKPQDMEILGQNVKVNYTARPGNYRVTGTYQAPSGDTITTDTVVTLYGPKTEWERYQVTGGGYGLSGAYSADGKQLALGSSSGAINVYDVGATPSQYQIKQVIMAHEGQIPYVAYLDSARIVTVGSEGTIKTWAMDVPTSTPLTVFTHDAGIVCAALSGSGATAMLAVGDEIGRVGLFDLSKNAFTWLVPGHTGKTQCVALDSTQVLSGGADNVVMVFNRTDGSRVRPSGLLVHTKPVTAVGYLGTDGFYSAGEDQTLTRWRKSDLEVIDRYEYPAAVTAAQVIGEQLYVATSDPVSTWIYNKDGLLLRWLDHPPAEGKIVRYLVDPSGQYVVTGRTTGRKTVGVQFMGMDIGKEEKISQFSSFQFWEVGRGIFRGSLAHSYPMSGAHISDDGKTVFTQDPKRTMKWTPGTNRVDMNSVRLMETGYFIAPKFEGMDFTEDSSKLATRVGVSIFMYDTAHDLLWKTLHTPASAFAISPQGTRMVTADSKVRLWDLANLSQIREESRVAGALDFRLENYFLGGMYDERFIGIWNNAGLLFNGMKTRHSPLQLFVNKLGTRCVAVTEEVSGDDIEQTHMFYLETYDISDLVAGPSLVNEIFIMSITVDSMMGESVDASFTIAISEDGTLALVGVSGGSKPGQSARPVRLINMNDGSTIREFLPASGMGEENIGASAVGFANNDQTLMIGWREGYVSLYHRILAGNLEVYLDFPQTSATLKTASAGPGNDGAVQVVSKAMVEGTEINASPGNVINGRAFVNYKNGTRLNVTSTIEFEAAPANYVQIDGAEITIDPDAPTPSQVTLTARYVELGTEMQTQVLLNIIDPQAPVIAEIPDGSVSVGDPYTGPTPAMVQGVQPISWSLVTGPTGMTIDAGTGVVSWATAVEGVTTVTIRATNTQGSDDESWLLNVYPKNLANAVDASALPMTWSTKGDAQWFYQTAVTHDGVDAAQSGNTGYNVPSTLRADISTAEHRTLTFWWKLSAHNDTTLRFYVDDVQQASINGEVDWTSQTLEVPAGAHSLKWVYTRGWWTAGSNAGWVDQVTFAPSIWPERPVLLTPANNATNVEPDVMFTWNGGGLTDSYDFYLWKTNEAKPVVPTQSGLTGKTFQVPGGLAYWTDYRWQVVARNAQGTVASTEAAFRTIYLTAPEVPKTPSPEDNSTTASVALTLDWADSKRATTYDVFLWKATEGQPWTPTSSGLTVSQYAVPQTLPYDIAYKWKVVARNTAGGTEGPVWNFTTLLLKPETPSQPVPEDGATTASVTALQLDWADTPMATAYDLKFWRADKPMPTTFTATGLTASVYPLPAALDYLTTYSWQVVAKNRVGSTDGPVWTFRTDIQAPFSPYPEEASVCFPVDATFTWGRSTGALSWDLYLWKKSQAKPGTPTITGLTNPAWKPTADLDFDTEYQWQVVVNGKDTQLAGPVWSFRTHIEGSPSAAKLLNPPDGSTGVSVAINPAWEASTRAGSYYLVYFWREVDGKPGWPSYAYSTEFDPGDLAYNTVYKWQVVAHNATGDTVGPVWTFRTQRVGSPEPVIPDNPSPYAGETNVPVDKTLDWSDATDALWYNVYLWSSTQPRPTTPTTSGLTTSSYKPVGSLEGNTKYYWVVTAGNAKGETIGTLWSFTTETPAQPGTPGDPSPADGATAVLPTTALDWSDASSASRYDLYLWKSTEAKPAQATATNLTESRYTPPAMLDGATTYKWQVIARNIVGQTPGPEWSFTTRAVVLPDKPQLISPENNGEGVVEAPLFDWSDTANADSYILAVWKQGDTVPTTVSLNWSSYWWAGPDFLEATSYNWQVTAVNWAGRTASDVFTFTTRVAGAPGVPSWPTPSNGAVDVALMPTFYWTGGLNALTHDFYLWKATDPVPTAPMASDLVNTQYTPSGTLESNTTYNWKVVAKNAIGNTSGSVWSFTTTYIPPIPAPNGLVASQGEWGSKVNVSWQPVAGGYYYYRVYRAQSLTDTPEALSAWQYNTTSFEDVTAKRRQTYTYWVQAANGSSGENAGTLAGPVQGWLYLPTLPLRAYKITYSKETTLTFDSPTTGGLTLSGTTARSSIKIKLLPKGLPAGTASGQIVKPGTAYLETREIPSVLIPGPFGTFASDAPIYRMQASAVKSVTAANGLEEYTGGDLGTLKVTASYNSSRTNYTEFGVTSIQTVGSIPLTVAINGAVLERIQTSQPVKSVKVATRKFKDKATKENRFSQAGIGALGDVDKDAKGGTLLSVQDSWLSAPSFALVQSTGGPVVLGLLEGTTGPVAKVMVGGGSYSTTAVGTRILQGNLRTTELKSAGPIALLSAKTARVGTVYLGGYLGFPWEPNRMTVMAQPKAGTISCITTLSGLNGVSGHFYAGFNPDGIPTCSGGIKSIVTSKTGRIEGLAFISSDPKAKPKFKPVQPPTTQFALYTSVEGIH